MCFLPLQRTPFNSRRGHSIFFPIHPPFTFIALFSSFPPSINSFIPPVKWPSRRTEHLPFI
jgi:hypothetical protein